MAKPKKLPLCSSAQVVAALERLDCTGRKKSKGGSHRMYSRVNPVDGQKDSAPVLLGKKEIPRGVLEDILKLLRISEADFLIALR